MKKNANLKKLISVNPQTIRLISSAAGASVVGGNTYTQLYHSCKACGSTTMFC